MTREQFIKLCDRECQRVALTEFASLKNSLLAFLNSNHVLIRLVPE